MHRDDIGELGRTADALFRALHRLDPATRPSMLDVSRCDALGPDSDTEHLILQGKLCAQRLYRLDRPDSRRPDRDQDAVIVLVSHLDLVVRSIVRGAAEDSEELRRLVDGWERLQAVTMELERIHGSERH